MAKRRRDSAERSRAGRDSGREARRHGTGTGRRAGGRPWNGRWRISPSARRCSRAPICSPARWQRDPGAVARPRKGVGRSRRSEGRLHAAPALHAGDGMTTDKALADERETIGLMRDGQDRGRAAMRSWMASARLHKGPLTEGQKQAVKLILSSKDRVVGVQGYAGTGKTTMLRRANALAGKRGYRMMGLAPSASAVKTLGTEAGIESETLQRFLARNAGDRRGTS